MVECCFTSTGTVGLLGTGAQDVHLDFHTASELCLLTDDDDEVMLNVLRCQLTFNYQGQAETNVEAWFSIALRPRKPEGSLGRTAQDVHLDSHTAPELYEQHSNQKVIIYS